jgi:cytochrome c-type protein NapB
MTKAEVTAALQGYKAGTYGAAMKGLMKGQVAKYSNADLAATGIGK